MITHISHWRIGAPLLAAGVLAGTWHVHADDLYERFAQAGLLDGYMQPVVEEILADIIRGDGTWREAAVNAPRRPNAIAVLVVDSRAAAAATLDPLTRTVLAKLRNGALADTASGTILLDGDQLRRWAAAATLYARDFSTMDASIAVAVTPLAEMRDLWDPAQNRVLAVATGLVDAREFFAGAVAFTLAHEAHHLQAADDMIESTPDPPELEGRAARLRWACPELIDRRFTRFRDSERRADAHAVAVLARIPHSAGGAARRLKYEFGTYWLGLHLMGNTMAGIAATIDDPFYRAVIAQQANPRLAEALFATATAVRGREALTEMVFHKSHPADVERLLSASQELRNQPGSTFYGNPGASVSADAAIWQLLTQRICAEAEANR